MRIVPNSKADDEACKNLALAKDDDIKPHIYELLECLQDLNWPIAAPVSERLSVLGVELVEPILDVLNSDDDPWKYWIVSHFLHGIKPAIYGRLRFKLNQMKKHPTKGEVEEEVHDAVCELLSSRRNS